MNKEPENHEGKNAESFSRPALPPRAVPGRHPAHHQLQESKEPATVNPIPGTSADPGKPQRAFAGAVQPSGGPLGTAARTPTGRWGTRGPSRQ